MRCFGVASVQARIVRGVASVNRGPKHFVSIGIASVDASWCTNERRPISISQLPISLPLFCTRQSARGGRFHEFTNRHWDRRLAESHPQSVGSVYFSVRKFTTLNRSCRKFALIPPWSERPRAIKAETSSASLCRNVSAFGMC